MTKSRAVTVQVYNVPDYANDHDFMVAKYDAGRLWFYGAYDDENRALEVANEIDGLEININE